MNYKKYIFIILGGAIMMAGDYVLSYYDSTLLFFIGEIVSLGGWATFIFAFDKFNHP